MGNEIPADHLDELQRLRVAKQTDELRERATEIWDRWCSDGYDADTGIAAVCQQAFAGLIRDDFEEAQVWRARGSAMAAWETDLPTMAMLVLPIAFRAADIGRLDDALEVMDLLPRLARAAEVRSAGQTRPGVPTSVVLRSYDEKSGYYLWKAEQYERSAERYAAAARSVGRNAEDPDSRDAVRVDGGALLAELGVTSTDGVIAHPEHAARQFDDLADRADAGPWFDCADPMRRNAEGLRDGTIRRVQDLHHLEADPPPLPPEDEAG
jgi:hypothetical protein